jgi:inosose dehydratase
MKTLSRRAFVGRSVAAGAALAVAPALRGLGGRERPARKPAGRSFDLGVASYTFREFGLEAALAMTRRVGLTRICLKDVHLPLQSSDAEIASAMRMIRESGIAAYACGVIYMKSPAEVERAFAYAAAGGMGLIVGVPEPDLLALAATKARETGIRLAVHNHGPGDPLYPTPQSVYEKVRTLGPGVGLCLDVGHCQRSGIDPAAAAAACADRLLDLHLKDVTAASKEGEAVEIGRGVIDIPRLLRTLARVNYLGTASFEYEKDSRDPLPGLAESVGYVRGVLALL